MLNYAKSEKLVELRVKMPKEEFSGQLAGGITFSEKVDETKDKQKENTNGLAIENRYAYTMFYFEKMKQLCNLNCL